MTLKKLDPRKKFRNSVIAITILFTILFSGITPLVDWGPFKEKPEPVWYDPQLADFLYEDTVNQTTYNFNAYKESYIICNIQNAVYTNFTFNSSTYDVSYGLNVFPIDFGTGNQSYSIEISQSDADNDVFDWICVQPLFIKEDIIDVNLSSTTDIIFNAGGMISILVQPNFTYNCLYLELDGNILNDNIYQTSEYPEVDPVHLIVYRFDGLYIHYDLDLTPSNHILKIKGNGTIDYKIIVSSDWDEDYLSDVEEVQKQGLDMRFDPIEPNVWGFFETGDLIVPMVDNPLGEEQTAVFTFYIPEKYADGYFSINVFNGKMSNIMLDDNDLLFKDETLSANFLDSPISRFGGKLSSGLHILSYDYFDETFFKISFTYNGRLFLVLNRPEFKDSDADGIKNTKEDFIGTDLLNPDSDFDGLTDIFDNSPLTSLILDKDKICQIIMPHYSSKNTLMSIIIKRPENDYFTNETVLWNNLEVSILPTLRFFGNSSITSTELEETWQKSIVTYNLPDTSSAYGDGIPDQENQNGELTLITPKLSEGSFDFTFNYQINNPAKTDSIIDMRFDVIWTVFAHYPNSTEIIHFYPFDDDIVIQSISKREIGNVTYILASPDSMIENEIFLNLVQNPDLGSASYFGVNDDIVGNGNVDYFELIDQLKEDRENNPISLDENGNIDENEVLYVSGNFSSYDILQKIDNLIKYQDEIPAELSYYGDYEALYYFSSISDVVEEDIASLIPEENIGIAEPSYIKSWDNYSLGETGGFEKRLSIPNFPVYMKRITTFQDAEVLEVSTVIGSAIPLNELPYSREDVSYDKLNFINTTIIEKDDSTSGIPKLSHDYENDEYKESYDSRLLEVPLSKLMFTEYSYSIAQSIQNILNLYKEFNTGVDYYSFYFVLDRQVEVEFYGSSIYPDIQSVDDFYRGNPAIDVMQQDVLKRWTNRMENLALPDNMRIDAYKKYISWLQSENGRINFKAQYELAYGLYLENPDDPILQKNLIDIENQIEDFAKQREMHLRHAERMRYKLECKDSGTIGKIKAFLHRESIKFRIKNIALGVFCVSVGGFYIFQGISELLALEGEDRGEDRFRYDVRLYSGLAKLGLGTLLVLTGFRMLTLSYWKHAIRLGMGVKGALSKSIKGFGIAGNVFSAIIMICDYLFYMDYLYSLDLTQAEFDLRFTLYTITYVILAVIPMIISFFNPVLGLVVGILFSFIALVISWRFPPKNPNVEVIPKDTQFSFNEEEFKRNGGLEVGDEVNFNLRIHNDGECAAWLRSNFSAGGSAFSDYEGKWETEDYYVPHPTQSGGEYATLELSRTLPNTEPNLELKVGMQVDAYPSSERIEIYRGVEEYYLSTPILDNSIEDFYDDLEEWEKPDTYGSLIEEFKIKDSYQHKDINEVLNKLRQRVSEDFLNDTTGSVPDGWSSTYSGNLSYSKIIRPDDDGDSTLGFWSYPESGDHYINIDDDVEYPNVGDGSYVRAYHFDDYHDEAFEMESFTIEQGEEIENIVVRLRGKATNQEHDDDPHMMVRIYWDSEWLWQTLNLTDSYQWYTIVFSDLTMDQTGLNDLQVKLDALIMPEPTSYIWVDTMYCEVGLVQSDEFDKTAVVDEDVIKNHVNSIDFEFPSNASYNSTINMYKSIGTNFETGSGVMEFWLCLDNTKVDVNGFFVINGLGDMLEYDDETFISKYKLNEWNHLKVEFDATGGTDIIDLWLNGIKIGDDIEYVRSDDWGANVFYFEFFKDYDHANEIYIYKEANGYLDAIDVSWSRGYYEGRSFYWEYTLDNITYYQDLFDSTLLSGENIVWCLPDGDSSPNEWNDGVGTPHWDDLDDNPNDPDGNYIQEYSDNQIDQFTIADGDIDGGNVYKIDVLVNYDEVGYDPGNDAFVDLYFATTWQGYIEMSAGINTYSWYVEGDQDDVNNMEVRFKSMTNGFMTYYNLINAFRVQVYYNDTIINTNIGTDLSENIVEMNTTTDITEFDFDLDLDGTHNPTVNYTFSIPEGFSITPNSIEQSLDATVQFNISANDSYELAGIYYFDMNITETTGNNVIYSEQVPFRIPIVEDFQITQSNVIFDETEFIGNYTATYDFLDDDIGEDPSGWTVYEYGGTANIIASLEEHNNVVELYDWSDSSYASIHSEIGGQTEGAVEFWMKCSDTSKDARVRLWDNPGDNGIYLVINDGKIKYYDGSEHIITSINSNQWYHIKIIFDISEGWQLYINENYQGTYNLWSSLSAMDYIEFKTHNYADGSDYGHYVYIDAVGYSWDSDYIIGDNLYKTDTSTEEYQSTTQLEKGDVLYIEYKTNTYAEVIMDFLNNDVIQATYTVVPRGNLYKGIQYQQIIIDDAFSFDEIEFSNHKYNYFEVYHISIIDATATIAQQFNPIDFTNEGNIPKFVTLDFSGIVNTIENSTEYDTGWVESQTQANVDRDGERYWLNPTYAELEDGNNAIVDADKLDYSDWLRLADFYNSGSGYNIPIGAEILGIEVKIKRKGEETNMLSDDSLRLRKTSGQVGDDKASATKYPIILTWTTYGSSTDTWNAGLTVSDLNSADFGVDLSSANAYSKSRKAEVDAIFIKIHYKIYGDDIEEPYESQILTIEPNENKIMNLDLNLPIESISNLLWRGIIYSECGTNNIYNIYIDNLEFDGIYIATPEDEINVIGDTITSSRHEFNLNIIPEETLIETKYSLNGNTNVTFTGNNVNISIPEISGTHTIQVFGKNSEEIIFESEVKNFTINYPIKVSTITNGTIYHDTNNEIYTNATFTDCLDFEYSLDGRPRKNLNTTTNLIEHIPYGARNIIIYGNDTYGDEYSSGLIEFYIALDRQSASQPDGFTFTNGTFLEPYGDLQFIDGNYSIIDSDYGIFAPDEFIDSITYTWGSEGGGTLENTQTDDTNYKWINSMFKGYPVYMAWINIDFNFDPTLSGRDFYISTHIVSSGAIGGLYINGELWKSGINIDFDNELYEGVTSIKYCSNLFSTNFHSFIYYFNLIEDIEEAIPALLDVQIDMQVDDEDLHEVEYLQYSHKTNVSTIVDLDIWNWTSSQWDEIESTNNYETFDDHRMVLGNRSDYLNLTNNSVRIRFQSVNNRTNIQLELDSLKLLYSTNIIPLNLYETPIYPNDFTFEHGNFDTYGELETIDDDYSIIKSTHGVFIPDEFIDSITYTRGYAGIEPLSNTQTDDENYFQVNSQGIYYGKPIFVWVYYIDILFVIDPAYGSRDFLFSCDIVTGTSISLRVNGIQKASGTMIDFDDMLIEDVTSIQLYAYRENTNFDSKIYYWKLVENLEETPVDLDFQIDLQIDDEYCYFPNSISYSYKTNVSQTIDFDIWNWDTETWVEIESVNNYETFDEDIFYLDYGSAYVNSSNGIRIRFQAFDCENDFQIEIDQLRLDYYNIG